MSSTNKTSNLKLNSWLGTDKPQRIDFNRDNEIIDNAFTEHCDDSVVHITDDERQLWNSFSYIGVYFGNGSSQRVVDLGINFDASVVIVFANGRPLHVTYFSNNKTSNYLAIASRTSNTYGLKLNDDLKSITVYQDSTPLMQNEYCNMNESGVQYSFIALR